MTPKYDVEMLLSDIKELLLADLNEFISDLNAEKNDAIVLKPISQDAYFLQELNSRETNFNPFILLAEEAISSVTIPGGSVETIKISVTIIVQDLGEDVGDAISNRMFRYRRALKEVVEGSFQIVSSANILTVQSLPIVGFQIGEGNSYRSIGIEIVSSIG